MIKNEKLNGRRFGKLFPTAAKPKGAREAIDADDVRAVQACEELPTAVASECVRKIPKVGMIKRKERKARNIAKALPN